MGALSGDTLPATKPYRPRLGPSSTVSDKNGVLRAEEAGGIGGSDLTARVVNDGIRVYPSAMAQTNQNYLDRNRFFPDARDRRIREQFG
ncbi:hypothetical protein CIB48_g331 [Xylaria polymorpha]|nr:hypothetical protein CIB48_g331 [Xylaria polymorpha]